MWKWSISTSDLHAFVHPRQTNPEPSEFTVRLKTAKSRAGLEMATHRALIQSVARDPALLQISDAQWQHRKSDMENRPAIGRGGNSSRMRIAIASIIGAALLAGSLPAVTLALSPIIVSGTLRNSAGTATAGSLLLFLVDRRSDGKTALVDGMNTSNGNFTIRLDNTALMQSAGADNSGYVNLMLVGVNSQGSGVHFFSRRYSGGSWLGRYGTSSVSLKTTLAHTGTDSQGFQQLWNRLGIVIIPPIGDHTCGYNVLQSQIQPAMVGELFVSNNTNGIFTYGQGFKTDTEFGVKVSDNNNVFSAKGTVQIAVEGMDEIELKRGFQSPVTGTYSKGVMSNFKFERQQKGAPLWDTWCWFMPNFRIVVTDWNRGIVEGWNMPGFLNICDEMPADSREPYPAGGGFTRSTNQAITYGGGASAFGLSFDTKSGFSTSVNLEFDMGAQYSTYWFCGDTNGGTPGFNSLRVFAGPNDL